MRLIILSILSIFTVFTFAQTVTIGAGAEIRVAGINAATSNDAILDIDGDLVIENTGQLDADRDGRFFISGDITYEGNAYARARGIMTLDGTAPQQIVNTAGNSDFAIYDLVIDNPTTVTINTINNADLDIFNVLEVKQGDLITNDRLFIESRQRSSDNQIFHARVATLGSGATITGNTRIEKRLTNTNDGWRQLALPIEATIASLSSPNATFLVDGHTPAEQINTYWWDPSPSGVSDFANGWTIASTTDNQLKAYSVFLSGTNGVHNVTPTFSFLGELNEGDFVNALDYQRDPADVTAMNDDAIGWNFIPNPWPAYVDVFEFINSATFTSGYKAVHVWDAINQQYRPILENGATFINYNTDGTALDSATTNIPTFQGFWVKATAGSQNADLIEATMRTTDIAANVPFMKKQDPTIRLNVFDTDSLWNQLVVYFNEGASRDFDLSHDGYFLKSQNENVPSIYGREGHSRASIISRPADITDSIEVSYESTKKNLFYLNFDLNAADQNLFYYLRDRYSNEVFEIKNGENLAFTNTGSGANRFVLYYTKMPQAFEHLITGEQPEIFAFAQDGNIVIKSLGVTGPATVNVFDMTGRQLQSEQVLVEAGEHKLINMSVSRTLVMVSVAINGQLQNFKLYL